MPEGAVSGGGVFGCVNLTFGTSLGRSCGGAECCLYMTHLRTVLGSSENLPGCGSNTLLL